MADLPKQGVLTVETAHQVYEALVKTGFVVGGKEPFVAMLQRLDRGLPAEDEFACLLKWLGRCACVHGLDQRQSESSKAKYKIPDLLALLHLDGVARPFLIEVKTTSGERKRLKWSQAYRAKLVAYADQVGIPLLIAWRHEPLDLWLLFGVNEMGPDAGIDLDDALCQNLMSAVAGDFAIVLKNGFGLHFAMEPVRFMGDGPPHAAPDLLSPGEWQFKIKDAYFINGTGERLNTVQEGLWPVLLTLPDLEHECSFQEGVMTVSYVIKGNTGMQWAQRVMAGLVWSRLDGLKRPDWRRMAVEERFPVSAEVVRTGMEKGFENGTVQYVFTQQPATLPAFLGP